VIFEVIGTPSVDDLPHLDADTASLLSNLGYRPPQVFKQRILDFLFFVLDFLMWFRKVERGNEVLLVFRSF